MTTTPTGDDFSLAPSLSPLSFSEPQWLQWVSYGRYRPNVLIETAGVDSDLVIATLKDVCVRPLYFRDLPGRLNLPCEAPSTILVRDVARLTNAQQAELHEWIGRCRPAAQVIAVTGTRLFDFVNAGQFHLELFYRLNMARVNVTGNSSERE